MDLNHNLLCKEGKKIEGKQSPPLAWPLEKTPNGKNNEQWIEWNEWMKSKEMKEMIEHGTKRDNQTNETKWENPTYGHHTQPKAKNQSKIV